MNAKEKSFEFVQDTSKLIITLSTTFLAFGITFSKELDGFQLVTQWDKYTWSLTLTFMLLSIGCGIWALLGLATVLEPKNKPKDYEPSIRNQKIKSPFASQIILFGIAILCFTLFGFGKIF